MSNDDSFRGGPRRPGGGFRPRGDGPRPAGPPRDAGDRPRKPFFRDGDAPRGPRRDFNDSPKRDVNAGPRREGGDAPRGPRRDFGDGPRRDFNAGPRREGGDAPRRSFDGPRDFRRDGDAPRGPRRDFGDGPRRDFNAAPRREGGDAPRRSFDGPRDFRRDGDAPRGPRRDFGDGPKRDFSAGPRREGGDAPRRDFNAGPRREGGDAPRRSFDGPRDFRRDGDAPRGPRRDFGDGPKRDFSAGPRREGGDAPRRDFSAGPRREGGDSPRRSFDGPRDFRREGDAPRGPRRDFGSGPRRDSGAGPRREGGGARGSDAHRDYRREERPANRSFFRPDAPAETPNPAETVVDDRLNPDTAHLVAPTADADPWTRNPASLSDDWEVPLPEFDVEGEEGAAPVALAVDADQMLEPGELLPTEEPNPIDDPESDAEPLAPPTIPEAADYPSAGDAPRAREEFRRAPERPESRSFDHEARRAQRQREVRIHGMNACLAVIRDRRDAVRKVYLRNDRAQRLAELLDWCRSQHLAYRYVSDSELIALTGSEHHEGICLEIERKPFLAFETLLNQLKLDHGPKVLLLLDGVGNPHNIGGILRAAAHFGVQALLLPPDSAVQLSAATYRTAEGGAELIPIVKLRELNRDLEALSALDFHVIGSFPREATSIHTTRWPERTLLVIGAEQDGIRPATAALCDRRFTIPGSGLVESLNAATATAVLLSAYAGSVAREQWAAGKA